MTRLILNIQSPRFVIKPLSDRVVVRSSINIYKRRNVVSQKLNLNLPQMPDGVQNLYICDLLPHFTIILVTLGIYRIEVRH